MEKDIIIKMKMIDDTSRKGNNIRHLVKKITEYCRECEDSGLDYEKYIDRTELEIILKQFECVINHKENIPQRWYDE